NAASRSASLPANIPDREPRFAAGTATKPSRSSASIPSASRSGSTGPERAAIPTRSPGSTGGGSWAGEITIGLYERSAREGNSAGAHRKPNSVSPRQAAVRGHSSETGVAAGFKQPTRKRPAPARKPERSGTGSPRKSAPL